MTFSTSQEKRKQRPRGVEVLGGFIEAVFAPMAGSNAATHRDIAESGVGLALAGFLLANVFQC